MDNPLDHPAVTQRVFYPRPTSTPPTLVVDADGHRLGCHVRRVDPDAGWVVYFHGNGELAADCERFVGPLFDQVGVNVCFAEYRGYGTSDGQPSLTGMLPDGEKILAQLGVPPERVAAFGRSLGSLYAIELARRLPTLAGLVLESGIAAVAELWPLGPDAEAALASHFDHQAKLGEYAGPLLVLHATADRLVKQSHANRLHAWGNGADKRLVLFPHGDHNTILSANLPEYVSELRAFFTKVGLVAGPAKNFAE